MNDLNRYEETPKKDNIFLVIIKMFITYIRNICYDFFTSFKYNNMKLPGLLILIPGALFGFSLAFHSETVKYVVTTFNTNISTNYKGCTDITGLLLFILMLFAILNIFAGFTLMNKKNLGSVIVCLLSSLVMIVCGAIYIYLVMTFFEGANKFHDMLEKCMKEMNVDDITAKIILNDKTSEYYVVGINVGTRPVMGFKVIMSIASIIFFILSSIIGIVLGFINYDRTYEKVKR